METDKEETDHESLHRELEDQREDMESRRDDLAGDTHAARQDIETKVGDQNVPGAQDEHTEIIHGRKAVEAEDDEEGGENRHEQAEDDRGDDDADDSRNGGSEGAGYEG
jgi:hypothetical protein